MVEAAPPACETESDWLAWMLTNHFREGTVATSTFCAGGIRTRSEGYVLETREAWDAFSRHGWRWGVVGLV